jgi:hypothetical protein
MPRFLGMLVLEGVMPRWLRRVIRVTPYSVWMFVGIGPLG